MGCKKGLKEEDGSIYCMWAMIMCYALSALGGRGYLVGPSPIDWIVHAPSAY